MEYSGRWNFRILKSLQNWFSKLLNPAFQKGMTLIEIMVVVAIIGSIMAVITVNVVDYLDESKVETTKIGIGNIEKALQQYKRKHGSFPTSEQTLRALVEKPTSGKVPENYPKSGYLEERQLKDAWGKDLIYYSPGVAGHEYEIISFGRDETEGGEDYDADLKSYEISK